MAKINNQAIMQKLIDELELYPAKDAIPTELAEKILPVYQVNEQDVNVKLKPTYFLMQDITLNNSDKTFTIPDGHTYILKYGFMKFVATATVGTRVFVMWIKDSAGTILWQVEIGSTTASNTIYRRFSPNHWKTEDVTNNAYACKFAPLPSELVLKEGYTLQIKDTTAVAAAADDMELSFMVEDIEE